MGSRFETQAFKLLTGIFITSGEHCPASAIMKSSMLASVIASAGAAGTLKLAYQDCGAAHGKVTGLSPNTLTLGQRTTVTGSGSVDEAVTDGTFEMNIKASILSKTCTGNICQPSTCPLPAGVGSITWNGMKCPLSKGDVTVGTDVILSGALPPWAARATIGIKGKASNGDDLLCMTLSTAPAEAPIVVRQSPPLSAFRLGALPDCSAAKCETACTCMESTCTSEAQACLADATCASVQTCMSQCACGDAFCLMSCFMGHRSSALTDLAQCARKNCHASELAVASTEAESADADGFLNGGTLKLAYRDCGAAHGKVTGLSPSTLTLGQKTTVTGSGSVDEAVTDGT